MIHPSSLKFLTAAVVTLSLAAGPMLSFGQATNAPTAPAATPPVSSAPAAASTPAPAPAETPAASNEPRPETYTIQAGDTLWSISHKYDTSIHALQKLNHLKRHALLHIGQVIKLPPATSDATAK